MPAMRATQDERPHTHLVTTPFVLSSLRSKVYRSMSGVATAGSRLMEGLKSIDTTMGYTPAGGIPMGTRSGDLDPGVMLELAKHYDSEALSDLVYHRMGLLALSAGESSEMHRLLESRSRDACFAVSYFCRQGWRHRRAGVQWRHRRTCAADTGIYLRTTWFSRLGPGRRSQSVRQYLDQRHWF